MKRKSFLLLLLLAGAFGYGVLRLLALRFETGDVYPEFSSLRSDPLGSRAFYEGLAGLSSVSCRRNFLPLARLEADGNAALLFLGVPAGELEEVDPPSVWRLEALARAGSRVVVALAPDVAGGGSRRGPQRIPDASSKRRESKSRPVRSPTPTPRADEQMVLSLSERWGFQLVFDLLEKKPYSATLKTAPDVPGEALPATLPWRSGIWFRGLDPGWRVVYERDRHPVLVERSIGKGAIVLSSDSSFASNAALREERRPELLVWLVGNPREVIFDETHLGLGETRGVAWLARKYRVHGLVAGLLLLAALALWKSSSPLVTPPPLGQSDSVSGRLASEGLAAVLRRNIPETQILETCYREWQRSFPGAELGGLEAILTGSRGGGEEPPAHTGLRARRDAVAAYRRASQMLAQRKRS